MMSFRGKASMATMMSLGGKLTALACHPTKRVNKLEESGNTNWGEGSVQLTSSLRELVLLISKLSFQYKRRSSKLVSTRRLTVLSLPLQLDFLALNYLSTNIDKTHKHHNYWQLILKHKLFTKVIKMPSWRLVWRHKCNFTNQYVQCAKPPS